MAKTIFINSETKGGGDDELEARPTGSFLRTLDAAGSPARTRR